MGGFKKAQSPAPSKNRSAAHPLTPRDPGEVTPDPSPDPAVRTALPCSGHRVPYSEHYKYNIFKFNSQGNVLQIPVLMLKVHHVANGCHQ